MRRTSSRSLLGVGPSLSHARRQDRRRADGALALAAAAAGAAGGPRPCRAGRIGRGSPGRRRAMRWPARRGPCGRPSRARRSRSRPRQLSVTTIEKWIANPYAVFAQRILGLEAAAHAGPPARRGAARPDRARRARPLRAALPGAAAGRHPCRARRLRQDGAGGAHRLAARRRLLGAALCPLRRLVRRDRARAPRRRGPDAGRGGGRHRAALAPPAPSRSRRAPTASMSATAGIVITDYKTGGNVKDLAEPRHAGRAPQLPLEAAIAAAGGFSGHLRRPRSRRLRYISASGGEPPGQECPLEDRRRRRGCAQRRARASCG